MGMLVNGKWTDQWYDTKASNGKFVREDSTFRNKLVPQNQIRESKNSFPAEADRYHLYISHACPWANRARIFLTLKDLQQIISFSAVDPIMLENGWEFSSENDETADPLYGNRFLYQLYQTSSPSYTGRVTVPILWDKQSKTIVNNESAEIIRIFNSAFDDLTDNRTDYYPADLREDIDEINRFVYHNINNGVYRCGFATTQAAYQEAFSDLFSALDEVEMILSSQKYLVGNWITEADWRLFTTLIRFDAVYYSHFKTNLRRIVDYPNLSNYVRSLYQVPGIRDTVHMDHIKQHYYISHQTINPTGIVPKGPKLNFDAPHDRERFNSDNL